MEVYRYPQFPPDLATIYVALFTEVQNASELKKRLVAASVMSGEDGDVEREAVNYAFIDARLVSTSLHAHPYTGSSIFRRSLVLYIFRPPYIMPFWLQLRMHCERRPFIPKFSGL